MIPQKSSIEFAICIAVALLMGASLGCGSVVKGVIKAGSSGAKAGSSGAKAGARASAKSTSHSAARYGTKAGSNANKPRGQMAVFAGANSDDSARLTGSVIDDAAQVSVREFSIHSSGNVGKGAVNPGADAVSNYLNDQEEN